MKILSGDFGLLVPRDYLPWDEGLASSSLDQDQTDASEPKNSKDLLEEASLPEDKKHHFQNYIDRGYALIVCRYDAKTTEIITPEKFGKLCTIVQKKLAQYYYIESYYRLNKDEEEPRDAEIFVQSKSDTSGQILVTLIPVWPMDKMFRNTCQQVLLGVLNRSLSKMRTSDQPKQTDHAGNLHFLVQSQNKIECGKCLNDLNITDKQKATVKQFIDAAKTSYYAFATSEFISSKTRQNNKIAATKILKSIDKMQQSMVEESLAESLEKPVVYTLDKQGVALRLDNVYCIEPNNTCLLISVVYTSKDCGKPHSHKQNLVGSSTQASPAVEQLAADIKSTTLNSDADIKTLDEGFESYNISAAESSQNSGEWTILNKEEEDEQASPEFEQLAADIKSTTLNSDADIKTLDEVFESYNISAAESSQNSGEWTILNKEEEYKTSAPSSAITKAQSVGNESSCAIQL